MLRNQRHPDPALEEFADFLKSLVGLAIFCLVLFLAIEAIDGPRPARGGAVANATEPAGRPAPAVD